MKNLIIFIFLSFLFKSGEILAVDPYWELVSMSPPRGTIKNIATNDANDIFITAQSGLFFSNNHGESWNKLLDEIVMPLSINRNDIYIRRIMKNGGNYDYKFYLSRDNGINWQEIIGTWSKDLIPYFFHTFNDSLIVILSHSDKLEIYLSLDKGIKWEKTGEIKRDTIIGSFLIPTFYINNQLIIPAYDEHYNLIYCISPNLGNSWEYFYLPVHCYDIKFYEGIYYLGTASGIFTYDFNSREFKLKWLNGIQILRIIFSNNDIIASSKDGIYYSFDDGNSWELSPSFDELSSEFRYCYDLLKDKEGTIYASPVYYGFYKSKDNGKTWEEKNNGFSALSANDISFLDSNIYFSSWGLFKSSNNGKTIENIGLNPYQLRSLAFNSKKEIFVSDLNYGGTKKGIFHSTNFGETWENFSTGEMGIQGMVISRKDIIFKSNGSGNVSRSTDNGKTWEYPRVVLGLYLAINDEDHIFGFSRGKIFRSTDDGITWEKVADTPVDPTYNEDGGRIIFNNKTKTAGYYDLVTTDNGRTWVEQIYSGMIFGTTESNYFAVDSTYNWIYSSNNYILRSTDNGMNWKRMDTSGLQQKEFKSIGCSPDGHIYVFGATGGLYRSHDRFVSVEENPKPSHEMIINPNPASDFIEISVINPMLKHGVEYSDIKILNIYAQTVLSVGIQNLEPLRIDVSGLSPGMYFVRIGDRVCKFVKI